MIYRLTINLLVLTSVLLASTALASPYLPSSDPNTVEPQATKTAQVHLLNNSPRIAWDADHLIQHSNNWSKSGWQESQKAAARVPIPTSGLLMFSGVMLYLGYINRIRIKLFFKRIYTCLSPKDDLKFEI